MTARQDEVTVDRTMRDTLASPIVSKHMLLVGAALVTAGGVALWLLPELSLWWVVVAVLAGIHIGLLMVIGATVLRWLTGRGTSSSR